MTTKTINNKSWKDYLKRLADDKVSNLLLSIMFLFDALQFAYGAKVVSFSTSPYCHLQRTSYGATSFYINERFSSAALPIRF